jgi:hypothetical protein
MFGTDRRPYVTQLLPGAESACEFFITVSAVGLWIAIELRIDILVDGLAEALQDDRDGVANVADRGFALCEKLAGYLIFWLLLVGKGDENSTELLEALLGFIDYWRRRWSVWHARIWSRNVVWFGAVHVVVKKSFLGV